MPRGREALYRALSAAACLGNSVPVNGIAIEYGCTFCTGESTRQRQSVRNGLPCGRGAPRGLKTATVCGRGYATFRLSYPPAMRRAAERNGGPRILPWAGPRLVVP